jgi:hypothetical protein
VFNDKKFMKNIVKEKDNASKAEDDVVDEEPDHRLTQLQNENCCVRPHCPSPSISRERPSRFWLSAWPVRR